MGFMDELKKLTQPYDDEDDYFEGSDTARRNENTVTPAQMAFEDTFAAQAEEEPEPAEQPAAQQPRRGSFLDALGLNKKEPAAQQSNYRRTAAQPRRPLKERTVNFGGSDTQVILFNPKSFDEAGDLVGYLQHGRSLVMTLEGLPTENARRLLDFISGITFALDGKVTPVAGKTYFITPQNVDLVAPAGDAPESEGQYF